MRMLINAMFAVAIIVTIAAVAFVAFGRDRTWQAIAGDADLGPRELTTITRTSKPHDALLCSQGLCARTTTDGKLPVFDLSPAALIAALDSAARSVDPNLERVDDGSKPETARYVTRSPLMRFPDTTWLQAVPLGDGKTGLIAYAQAQLGYSDLGANKARLEKWTAALVRE